jgi:hypothetical protein
MIVALTLVALSFAAPAEDEARGPDLSVPLGVGFHQRADGRGERVELHYGLAVGYALKALLDWPLRAEVSLLSSTAGPPWGAGVEAVKVSRVDLDLTLLVGADWTATSLRELRAGVEGLLGPRLRLIRVSTSVYGDSDSHYGAGVTAQGVAGLFATYGALRMSLRVAACLPWDRVVELWLTTGYAF